ncbi:MAG: flavodoxin family protein [Deltaproteobacteria bacterium]|nr:flavodoxin family protein [Deltaproteobacteria bacterium]MBW1960723.1 flavodoxin family protein [Deltaproteobacteria bacterium]MBW2151989.1 flavodoxin family protein [Deltaproteobacteria bacterium]
MKTVLGILGSPRKLGNCEIMVKEISEHISEPHRLKLLRLSDFNLLPCRGCYRCLFDENGCSQEDDFYTVLNEIIDADALILAVPTYFLGPNGCLKLFLDRGLAFYAHAETLWGKPSVGIGIAGISGKEGYTLLGIESFLKLVLSDIKMSTIIYGALPGEIFLNRKNRAVATQLGAALFGPPEKKHTPCCPLCGGDTFRFISENKVQCMLCSNTGILLQRAGIPVFQIEQTDHELFLSKEGVLKHREWLKGMKARFLQQKDELRKITGPYREKGDWVKPQYSTRKQKSR